MQKCLIFIRYWHSSWTRCKSEAVEINIMENVYTCCVTCEYQHSEFCIFCRRKIYFRGTFLLESQKGKFTNHVIYRSGRWFSWMTSNKIIKHFLLVFLFRSNLCSHHTTIRYSIWSLPNIYTPNSSSKIFHNSFYKRILKKNR